MRFAFLSRHQISFPAFQEIAKILKDRYGHETLFLSTEWQNFNFTKLENFKPDKLIIYNGKFNDIISASNFLKTRYKTFFCEMAWLPQAHSHYIDTDLFHLGEIAKNNNSEFDIETVSKIKNLYSGYKNILNDKEIKIFIPLQIEKDTSILYASENFKTMNSLIFFVQEKTKNQNVKIYVKEHPKNTVSALRPRFKNVIYSNKNTYELIESCNIAIGINSTCLIESRAMEKPTIQLGNSVFQTHADSFPDDLLIFMRNYKTDWARLCYLFSEQFNMSAPNEKIINYLIEK